MFIGPKAYINATSHMDQRFITLSLLQHSRRIYLVHLSVFPASRKSLYTILP